MILQAISGRLTWSALRTWVSSVFARSGDSLSGMVEHLFHTYNRSTHKTWSYSGCIDGRDLGNQTCWVCVQAALAIRRLHGCNNLHGVESCTSFPRAGDMIEAMLGIAWGLEHHCCRLSRDCMLMRTCVEAAVLGVERVLTLHPHACSSHDLVLEILHSSDFLVKLPEPLARGWSLQKNQKLLYSARVEARNVNRLVLGPIFMTFESIELLFELSSEYSVPDRVFVQ